MSRSIRLFMFAAPSRFYWLTGKLLPWLWATAALFVGVFPGPETLGLGRLGVEQGLAGLIGFYFGARS